MTGRDHRRAGRAALHSRELVEERAEAAEQAVRAERLGVARDLHDVVSHAVGVMVVQAGAAEALWGADRTAARRALDVVRSTSHEALRELDRLVATIEDGALGAPTPSRGAGGEAEVRRLVRRMGQAGLRVELVVEAPDDRLDAVVYRIVQESLTNALRHAPGARVQVVVRQERGRTHVDVVDDGPGPGAGTRRGYGLLGLAERVERTGGSFTAGVGPSGRGFAVQARLPHAEAALP